MFPLASPEGRTPGEAGEVAPWRGILASALKLAPPDTGINVIDETET